MKMIGKLLFILGLLLASPVMAQVTQGGKTTAIGDNSANTTSVSSSLGFNISASANRALVCVLWFDINPGTISVVINSQTMTQIGTNIGASWVSVGTGSGFVAIFGLIAPTTATTPSWTVTFTSGGAGSNMSVAFAEFDGVDQTGGATTFKSFQSGTGNATGVVGTSSPVAANNNDGLIAVITENRSGATVQSPLVSPLGGIFAGTNVIKDYGWAIATGSTTPQWSLAGTDQYAIAGVAVKQVGGAGSDTSLMLTGMGN